MSLPAAVPSNYYCLPIQPQTAHHKVGEIIRAGNKKAYFRAHFIDPGWRIPSSAGRQVFPFTIVVDPTTAADATTIQSQQIEINPTEPVEPENPQNVGTLSRTDGKVINQKLSCDEGSAIGIDEVFPVWNGIIIIKLGVEAGADLHYIGLQYTEVPTYSHFHIIVQQWEQSELGNCSRSLEQSSCSAVF